jgi:hypothetical protein
MPSIRDAAVAAPGCNARSAGRPATSNDISASVQC